MAVSRAGGKLEAAIAHFGLGGALRGARAVDVGASTGGFTEALLAHGAASVLAVDVGHGQLHPALGADGRVTSLEGVDWRKLSLNEAEGPFDFFTVDVSFVSARNMLRGLAFRLRPGAQGVVLVKPQFELPDRQVKGGQVDDPNLRRMALQKVRGRAEALGFEMKGEIDSPVAGGEGSIEILAHLVFSGRPSSLPAPGERRRDERPPKRKARASAPTSLRWFAVVAPGLEEVAAREIAALPDAAELRPEVGIVERSAPAIGDAVKGVRVAKDDETADVSILVRGLEDEFTFSVDASGERLHRRGARLEIGAAPLRETLAAGLLALAGWDPTLPLVDPMCGAGTIVIEAALQALDRAPGIDRAFGQGFAIDGWPLFSGGAAATAAAILRDQARGRIRAALPAPIVGSDHDARAIESAQRNADRAEVGAALTLASRDITDARPPGASPGLVIANPPYGRRLSDPRAAVRTYRELGRVLRAHFRGWRAAIVIPQQLRDAAAVGRAHV